MRLNSESKTATRKAAGMNALHAAYSLALSNGTTRLVKGVAKKK
jgi:hypothetical protein